MKSFISFGLILAAAQLVACGDDVGPKRKEMVEKCKAETNFNGSPFSIGKDASNDAKCFLACLMKNGGEVNDDGTFNVDKIKERIQSCKKSTDEEKEKMLKAAELCIKEVKPVEEPCQNAFNFDMCFKENKA